VCSSVFPALPAAPSRWSPPVSGQLGKPNAKSSSDQFAIRNGLDPYAWQATALVWSVLGPTSLKGVISENHVFRYVLFVLLSFPRCFVYSSCCLHARTQATAEIAYDQAAAAMPGKLPKKTCLWTSDIAPASRRWIKQVLGNDVIILSDVMLGRRLRFRFLIN
jgi:hypothetical protein